MTDTTATARPAPRTLTIAVGLSLIALGLVLRFAFISWVQPLDAAVYSDMQNYVGIADDIAKGIWRSGHFFQPIGYPLVLAAIKFAGLDWSAALGALHVAAAGLTLLLIWTVASLSFGTRVGLASLAVASLHLPWILFGSFALPETLFTLTLAGLALASWRVVKTFSITDGIVWGAVFTAALLLKGTHVFMVVLFLVALLLWAGRRSWPTALAICVVVWSGLLASGILSQVTIDRFQLTAAAGGLNFVEGKCPQKRNTDSTGAVWLSPLYFQLGKEENKTWNRPFTDSAYFVGEGVKCIADNPLVLVQSIEGIPFLFMGNWMWPASNFWFRDWIHLYEMFFAVFAVSGLCAAVAFSRSQRPRGREFLVWAVPVLSLFICVYVFKSEVRFRVPFDVWIVPLACKGWADLLMLSRHRPDPASV